MNGREKKIIFLSYLTNYNIREVYRGLAFARLDDYVEEFLRLSREANVPKPDNFIDRVTTLSRERYEEMQSDGISFITCDDALFPESLKKIYQVPPVLYLKGELKKRSNVAIIGTREVSPYAEGTVRTFVAGLSPAENGVVSGLALGVDTLAHRAALQQRIYTLAVMPCSLDTVYPKQNSELAEAILGEGGALLSELPKGINRGRKSFVERNRLQTGLSDFCLPVEMSISSGTMHTVNFCIKQEKYLLLFRPDGPRSALPQYEGISYLVKQPYAKKVYMDGRPDIAGFLKKVKAATDQTLF